MTEEVKDAAVNAQPAAKVRKRGVSNKTQAVNRLKFHETDAAQNGLFVGHLENAEVDWSTNADGKTFTGLKMPRLVITFASNHPAASDRRYVNLTLFPQESNVDTIPGGDKEWQVNSVLNWIKHVLDVFYLKGRELTEAEEDALTLPFVDYDEEGNYVSVDPQEVLNGYQFIFDNTVAMLNDTFATKADGEVSQPCYKTADGKVIPCWIKLLRHTKNKGQWYNVTNGDLAFGSFPGSGAFELQKKDKVPTLRVDYSRESITPKEVNKKPTVGAPNPAMMGGVVAGMQMPQNNTQSGAYADASDDMPF